MARAVLKFDDKQIAIGEEATSFGRTTDNDVSFPDNSNISRRHAAISFKDGAYVLEDLGSSNGTTVNGQKIAGETVLNDGDFITLGNSVIVEFEVEDGASENAGETDEANQTEAIPEAVPAEAAASSKSKSLAMLGLAGAVCGLAVVFAVGAAYVYLADRSASACDATARILSPANGDTVTQETEVKIDVKNSACVSTVHVLLNGKEIAALTEEPYAAPLDPKNFPDLADGGLYALSIILEDSAGNKIEQGREVALAFETREVKTPTPTATPVESQTPVTASGKQPTLIEVQKMTAAVVTKFTGANLKYNLSNPEFLAEVRKRSAEYSASEGYFARAAVYKDLINQSFVRDKALDASLPYILAMSRSQFKLENKAGGEGLWQMTNDFATVNAYNVACTTPSLSEPTQDCAAKAAALYMEDLFVKTFEGDVVFVAAAFGKTAQEANTWKQSLPADRSDFWKIITDTAQREQVARFFAAAIVAENPQKFGMKKDRPISELYPIVAK